MHKMLKFLFKHLCYLCYIVNKTLAHVIFKSFSFHFIKKNIPAFSEFGFYYIKVNSVMKKLSQYVLIKGAVCRIDT